MIVGVPRETYPGEQRVALVPAVIPNLLKAGLEVVVETGAGAAASHRDEDYASPGEYAPVAVGHPLEDVRVIAVEQYGAGPFGTVHLADLGAEVIKIEDPRSAGDISRYVPPHQQDEDSLFFETFNRNKRSLSLDLGTTAGREVFEDLVRVSDAVYSNLRGDVPDKLGIRYHDLAPLNPAIVCCSLSGFGTTGPRRSEPGYDYILQGLTGWMSLTGEPDGPPMRVGLYVADLVTPLYAALGIYGALRVKERTGKGQHIDASMIDTLAALMFMEPVEFVAAQGLPVRVGNRARDQNVSRRIYCWRHGHAAASSRASPRARGVD